MDKLVIGMNYDRIIFSTNLLIGGDYLASIGDIKRKLNDDFIDKLYETFTPGTADKILMGMLSDRLTTLRVNNLKYDIQSLMNYFKSINIKFERVQWYKDALIIKNAKEKDIEKLDIYKNGYIYMQSIPSMIPPVVLAPKKGEKVLDMSAAPGSKTTQLASIMENEGYILANELDKIRLERLKYNKELQGASIIELKLGRAEKIGDELPEHFDKVLADVPCSGEGRFLITSPRTYIGWSQKEVLKLSEMQKNILKSGYKALKKGGTLVYSTCTLNKEENEYVVDWATKNLGLEIISIDLKINGSISGMTEGVDKKLEKTLRILPSKDLEGFYICKFKKIK